MQNYLRAKGSVSSDASKYPGLIDVPEDVMPGGSNSPWPTLSSGNVDPTTRIDTDGDGMPDVWEAEHNLNPNNANDGKEKTLSDEDYTNLEVYLNSLVEEIINKQNNVNGGTGITDGLEQQSQIVAYAHQGTIYLKGLDQGNAIDVYSYTGSKIMSEKAHNEQETLQLPRGHYIIKVTTRDDVKALKVVNL